MNRSTFVKEIKESFRWALDSGYSFNHLEKNIYFVKENFNEEFCFRFHWTETNSINIQGVVIMKRFNKIEEIIEQHSDRYLYSIQKVLEDKNAGLVYRGIISLKDEEDVKKFSELIKRLYYSQMQPFINQFPNTESVVNFLENTELSEHSKFLVIDDNTMMLRKLIFLKETKSSSFTELYSMYDNLLKEKTDNGEEVFKAMLKKFNLYKDYFEKQNC